MLNRFFGTAENSITSGAIIGGTSFTVATIALFIAIDRSIRAQNDLSDGGARGVLSFIVGPIATYYSIQIGAAVGGVLGGIGYAGYQCVQYLRSKP